jgi:FAD synthetase
MVFGVFDLLHPGHIDFLKQAKRLGEELVVSVARDENVKRVKGFLPEQKEQERLDSVWTLDLADRVVLGSEDDPVGHIANESPDVIALGYDQDEYVNDLERQMADRGLEVEIVRLKPFQADKYKSSKLRKNGGKV